MVKEMAELKQKEIDDFEKKVVVANKHFGVNTKQGSHQMDKYKSMLTDPVQKIGLRLSQKRIRDMTARQILTTKTTEQPPVSVFSQETYIMNEGVVKPLKTKLDNTKTPHNRLLGHQETKDFQRYSKFEMLNKGMKINPVGEGDKTGPKWGK